MNRFALMSVVVLALTGCALPRLPALPTLADIRNTVAPPVAGESAREALLQARPLAVAWSPDAVLTTVRGSKIDTGGRNFGLSGGNWLFEFQSEARKLKYAIRIIHGQPSVGVEAPYETDLTPLDLNLTGLLDSGEAIARSGLNAKSYTVVLRGAPSGPRYDLIGEGSVVSATLDARTGAKI